MVGDSTREYRFLDQQEALLRRADELVGQCETGNGLAGLLPNIRSKRFKPVPPAPGMPRKTRREHERLCLEQMNEANLAAQSLAADVRKFRDYGHWPAGSNALRERWQQVSIALESGDPRGILHYALRFDDLDGMPAAIQRLKEAIAAVKAANGANAPAGQRSASKSGRKRGRRPTRDPKADARIADAWRSGTYKTYHDLAAAFDMKLAEVRKALDADRKRRKKPAE